MTKPTPTKPTIDEIFKELGFEYRKRLRSIGKGKYVEYGKSLWLIKCHGCEVDVEQFKQSLLQLVLDEVIIKDLPHVMGKCNKKWCYCSAYAINATLKHLKQRARELLK